MAAAYAAVLCVKQLLNQIEEHPRPPISLHQQQLHSLIQNLNFLQDFSNAIRAVAAEDVIESHIVDQIHATQNLSSIDLYHSLERVIQDTDSIKKEVMDIMGAHPNPSVSTALVRSVSRAQNSTLVDFGDILIEVLDTFTGQEYDLQIIPIVGMGGIGKTTFARTVYTNPLFVQHFYILAWVERSFTNSLSRNPREHR